MPAPPCVRISEFCALLGFGEVVVVPGAVDIPMPDDDPLADELPLAPAPLPVAPLPEVLLSVDEGIVVALFTSEPIVPEVLCAMGAVHHAPAISAASKVILNFILISFITFINRDV